MKPYSTKEKQQVSTLSLSDFNRIKSTIIPQISEDDNRKKFDNTLKSISHTKMRQWPDSIEMTKKNKLESRKKVFFEKEMEKRKIDEEEQKFQNMQKKITVERANKLLFDAQDPVKSFQSKLLFCDVLKEREFQHEIKQRKREIDDRIEKRWMDVQEHQLRDYDIKEIEKIEEENQKKHEQINCINQQFTDLKIKKVKEYQDRVIEGEIIKMKAKQAIEEDK